MKVLIVAVGRIKEKPERALLTDYFGRIRRYTKIEEAELEDGSPGEVIKRFERAIPAGARIVALEVLGERIRSEGLAKYFERCQNASVGTLAFLIGGSYGLPKSVSENADLRLSLSDLTLPHRLARIVLTEQIYRAFTILRNEPYSH